MIVKMSKYAFMVYHKEYDTFLSTLRDLGVVHIKETNSVMDNERLQELLAERKQINTLMRYFKNLHAAEKDVKFAPARELTKEEGLKLVRKIAAEFGVDAKGKYSDVYEDLTYYLRSIENPLIILDEAGDLQYEAFLELKALWNATERSCAWYMMGADGLKEKINRSIECKKVGYTEMLSRYGDRYSKVTPDDGKEREAFLNAQARTVAKVNAPAGADIAQIVRKTRGGLRRVYTEIEKLKMA